VTRDGGRLADGPVTVPGATEAAPAVAGASPVPAQRVTRCRLTDSDAAQAYLIAERCAREFGTVSDAQFLRDAAVIAHGLPRPLRDALNRTRLDDRAHALLITNNYVDDGRLGDTPPHWRSADTDRCRGAAFLLMLYAALLGDVIGWATQQDGRLVTDVLPTPGQEKSLLSSSSTKTLGWHTEDAFSSSRGDYVGLFCLRNPTQTATTLSYVDGRQLGADTLDLLAQPRFWTRPDESHAAPAGSGGAVPGPGQAPPAAAVLEGAPDAPVLRIDRDFTTAVPGDDRARFALRSLIDHLDARQYPLALEPGDMCFVDNRNVVHGRARFTPLYDGRDRWLKRVNIVTDLRRTRPDRRSSVTRVIG
jgi:Fe(II)/alpha-ketoglutarate-dependent arginine beta-hydroxylase